MDVINHGGDVCPLCGAGCTPEAISCGRGVQYFSAGGGRDEARRESAHDHHHHGMRGSDVPEVKIMQDFNKCAHYLLHRKGVKQGRSKVLNILKREGKMTQRELQERLDIRSASLSELLAKMEAKGFIVRTQNEVDKRTVDVALTELGRKACKQTEGGFVAASQELFGGLSDEEKVQLEGILGKLLGAWGVDGGGGF